MNPSLLGGATLLALALSPPVAAMRAAPPPLPELCAAADLVLLAEPTSSETAFTGSELRPVETRWDLWVERVVYGAAPAGPVQVATAGGRVGDLIQTVSEQPELKLDHRYLLLLRQRADGQFVVLGGPDGLLPVSRGPNGVGLPEDAALALLGGCHGG